MASTRESLIEELKALLEQDVMAVKDQVEAIKSQFYSINEEAESDSLEEEFKAALAQYKAKRAELAAQIAKEQETNLLRKQALLDEMKALAEGETDGVMANLQRMRELQAQWKTIGEVPAPHVQEIRKAYQRYQEQFYDLVKINIELRDLDFKKNLELKTLLCEAAERLQNNENIVEASRALQQLHDEWAEIGPVARELREELWNRFKDASTVINKKHQAYFDAIHAKEQENLETKRGLIEQLKAINTPIVNGEPINAKQWDEATTKVQEIQNAWRKVGFAPKKYNQSIYDEYRAECDRFFSTKKEFFRDIRDAFTVNLKHKRSLIGQANQIVEDLKTKMENNEVTREYWDEATKQVQALQAEWKTVGAVARKYSDELWKQFSESCDSFFNAKREAIKGERIKARGERIERAARAAVNQGTEGLIRMRDRLKQEIKTAENNILFFTAKSKTANKLVDSMQKKIDELKQQLQEIQEKIDAED
ncbi:MAG: DUF349 domain-containing protein [Paludibacteraceae bacterium]|nr:DUF349 domain-containing protein [Paludibacteraceae bacterium]MBR6492479.1 DUF349 domain-containing protein [Paludibacteraceae bacterium]